MRAVRGTNGLLFILGTLTKKNKIDREKEG